MEIRQQILFKTFELIMRYGIKSVSMDDIARQLGVSKKTIYQHFENKKTLIDLIVEEHVEEDKRELQAITEKSENAIIEIIAIAKHVLTFLRGMSSTMMYDMKKYYPKSWDKVERYHHSFIHKVIKDNIMRGMEEGHYMNDINPEILSTLYVSKSMIIADEHLFPMGSYNKEDLFKELITYHIRGIMSDKGRKSAADLSID